LQVLYELYADTVRQKLQKLGLEGLDLDDMVQTVYTVAGRRMSQIPKDEEGSRRWLLDVARKHAANWHRLYRHTFEMLDVEAVDYALSLPEDPEAYLALRDLVHETSRRLDPIDREVIMRHDVEGESLQEIADWLGITKSGAHVRLNLARERFIAMFFKLQRRPRAGIPALLAAAQGFIDSTIEGVFGDKRPIYQRLRVFFMQIWRLSRPVTTIGLITVVSPEETEPTCGPRAAPVPVEDAEPVADGAGHLDFSATNSPRPARPRISNLQGVMLTHRIPIPAPKPAPVPEPELPDEPNDGSEKPALLEHDVLKFAAECILHKQPELALVWLRYHEMNFLPPKQGLVVANLKKLVDGLNGQEKRTEEKLPEQFHPRTYLSGKMIKQLSKD
jgi:RNA polymerase sigma-70 factor, ECF subfamily